MKLLLSVAALLGVTAAVPQFGNNRFNTRPQPQPQFNNFPSQNVVPIIAYSNDQNVDGSYAWNYQTGDGISANAQGSVRPSNSRDAENPITTAVQGSYSYTAPDGQVITVNYIADENGYRAEGAHLPTPPPIPEAIARSLDLIQATQRNNPPQQPQRFG